MPNGLVAHAMKRLKIQDEREEITNGVTFINQSCRNFHFN